MVGAVHRNRLAIETRSLPALARRYLRGFTFCVAPPGRSAEVNRRYQIRVISGSVSSALLVSIPVHSWLMRKS